MMQAKYYSRSWTAPFRMDSALASRGFKHTLLVSTPKVAEQTMRKLVHLPRSARDAMAGVFKLCQCRTVSCVFARRLPEQAFVW